MRYATIILGIIAATFLLPQNAFARGGKAQKERERREARHEVPPVVAPVIVERTRKAPVVVKKRRGAPVLVERTRKAPVVVVAKTRPQPVVVAKARPKPVVVAKARPQPVVVRESRLNRHARGRVAVRHAAPRPNRGRRGYVRPQSHRHHAGCGWIEGHYESRSREICVPGYFRNEYVPPVYVERRGPRGICVKIMVRPAGLRKVWVPPTTMRRTEQVWVPGHYRCGC